MSKRILRRSSSSSSTQKTNNNNNKSIATPPPSLKRKSPEQPQQNTLRKKLFERLWSKEDEVHLLEGLINYIQQKGEYPFPDYIDDFHFFVKDSLNIDVNDTQITGKVKKLKSKFSKNVPRKHKLSDPHDKTMFELSRKIWGNETVRTTPVTANGNEAKKAKNGSDLGDLADAAAAVDMSFVGNVNGNVGGGVARVSLVSDDEIVKKALALMSGEKKAALENKWKEFKVKEMRLFMSKLEILKEPTEIVLNAVMEGRAT